MTVIVYRAGCRGSRKSGVSVAWCGGVVWCCAVRCAELLPAELYSLPLSLLQSPSLAMALSVKQDKINLDCWSAMDKIADCAARMLRGTKSTPGFSKLDFSLRNCHTRNGHISCVKAI